MRDGKYNKLERRKKKIFADVWVAVPPLDRHVTDKLWKRMDLLITVWALGYTPMLVTVKSSTGTHADINVNPGMNSVPDTLVLIIPPLAAPPYHSNASALLSDPGLASLLQLYVVLELAVQKLYWGIDPER